MGDQIIHAGPAVTGAEVKSGATRPGEVRYFRMPDGSIATRRLEAAGDDGQVWAASIPPPEGGRELDADEGRATLARFRELDAERKAAARAEAADKRATTHAALVALGLGAEAASHITGHRPASTE